MIMERKDSVNTRKRILKHGVVEWILQTQEIEARNRSGPEEEKGREVEERVARWMAVGNRSVW